MGTRPTVHRVEVNDMFTVEADPGEYCMEFRVIQGDCIVVTGCVDWQGCHKWHSGGMLHLCDVEGLDKFSQALRATWELAQKYVERWEG